MINLQKYQESARTTAIYPNIGNNPLYPMLGLIGETGELSEKLKKIIRDNGGKVTVDKLQMIIGEMGDVMWYIANLCCEFGIVLGDIDDDNIFRIHTNPNLVILTLTPSIAGLSRIVEEVETYKGGLVKKMNSSAVLADCTNMIKNLYRLGMIYGLDFNRVLELNLAKLFDRKSRDVLKGDGDNR